MFRLFTQYKIQNQTVGSSLKHKGRVSNYNVVGSFLIKSSYETSISDNTTISKSDNTSFTLH